MGKKQAMEWQNSFETPSKQWLTMLEQKLSQLTQIWPYFLPHAGPPRSVHQISTISKLGR